MMYTTEKKNAQTITDEFSRNIFTSKQKLNKNRI